MRSDALIDESIRVARFNSIHEVDEALWDSLAAGDSLFQTHRFVAAVEDAGVEDSRFWYLLFFSGDDLIATAALCAFTVSLDLFLDRWMQSAVASARRLFPRFLEIDILFCGLPISLGQHNLVVKEERYVAPVLADLDREMRAIAGEAGIRYACVKEFREDHAAMPTGSIDRLEELGYLKARSIPYMELELQWDDFESYLHAMRHPYRRSVLRSLKKLGAATPVIVPWEMRSHDDRPRLMLGTVDVVPPALFHRLYLQVMARATTRLETLNESFFHGCRTHLQDDLEMLALVAGGEVLGAALFTVQGDTMTFLLVGQAAERNEVCDPYFNLIYGLIDIAIARNCARLKLGQTAYWVKQRVGGTPHQVWFYLRAENGWIHRTLKLFRSVLFPETPLPSPRVFKDDPSNH